MWSTVCDMITFDFENVEKKLSNEEEIDNDLETEKNNSDK